jgi:hypothetical protein
MTDALDGAIALVPGSAAITEPGFIVIPGWSVGRLQGRELRLNLPPVSRNARQTRLTVSDDGLSLTFGPGRTVNIRYENCAAALTWNDGSRTLIGRDGFRIHVCPADWRDGNRTFARIDDRLPAKVIVRMGDRPRPDPERLTTGKERKGFRALLITIAIWLAGFGLWSYFSYRQTGNFDEVIRFGAGILFAVVAGAILLGLFGAGLFLYRRITRKSLDGVSR